MGLGDFVPDVVEDAVEEGVEAVGEAVDATSDWTADRLEDVGLESAAGWVRETGDSVANRMGAAPDELQLDQTEDPAKLIHGSVGKLRSTAEHLLDFRAAFTDVGNGLRGVDAEAFEGETADAFRGRVSVEPEKWFTAADACERAATALNDFAGVVEWAQGQARLAIDRYREARTASEEARTAHNEQVEAYNAAVDTYNATPPDQRGSVVVPPCPAEFRDPGVAMVEEAAEILAEARRQRNEAQERAVAAVAAARDMAPPKPSYSEQLGDAYLGVQLNSSHLMGGLVRGTAGLLNVARGVNPLDPYNLTHPAEYLTQLNSTAAGLVRMGNDPVGTAGTMWDSFARDPAEGTGRLIPELLGTKGAGAARAGANAARRAADAPSPGRTQVREDGPDAPRNTPEGQVTRGPTDPVNLATGRMFLPQTDVVLPGVLPLVFRRHVESGYRAGRWFGPSWASTVDQRLDVDAEGVVFLSEEGLVLAYPHPAPGVPTLPASGPRWPLESTPGGDYVLTDPESGRTWHFAGPGGDGEAPLLEIADRAGHRITFEYDEHGTPLGLVHSGGYHLEFTCENGRITALRLAGVDGEQPLVRYGYTGGDLTEVVNSSGLPLRFAYDDEHRVVAWTDRNGRRYDYAYDSRDRCVAEGGTEGHLAMRISYGEPDPATGLRTTTVTTSQGHTSRYVIDPACRVVAVTDPNGHTTRFTYDTHGNRLTRTDALGHTTVFSHDEAGRLVGVVLPDGTETSAVYNELGLPVTVTGPDGAVWRYTYDERGNRTAVTDPAGHTTRYAYDTASHLASVTDAPPDSVRGDSQGAVTRVRCDAAGLPLEITDPLGGVTRYERDAFGRPIALTDPLGGTTRLEWTPEGHLTRRVDAGGAEQSWSYDGEGNCVRHTDAGGGVTTFEYTHFDLLAARTDPDGARYTFAHDTQLRLTGVTNPQGLTWSYTYDPAGRLVAETDFDGRTLRYAHDATGHLISRTNPLGETVTLERDLLGRVIRKDAAGQVTTYTYDPAGRLASAAGPDAETVIRRDRLGRVKTEMINGRVLTHAYDPLGRVLRRTTPSGAVSTFAYDPAGRRTALTASGRTLAFDRDATGRETTRRIGSSLLLSQTWDEAGRLTAQTLTNATGPLHHRLYRYRADGHLTGLDDRTFDLDPMGRVTAVHAESWSETYAYDAAGNQTSASWPTTHPGHEATGPRTYTGTRLTRAGRMRYEYDEAGRVVLRQKTRLSKKP
ncbi:putative T7SS-secreted protein, partial [Streptomyces sp. URMC 129]|uniref:putative T7SS-secreted protein n=1 Tax=Streptomyces sp. URMC 129 TaxID=3423407 RepID=UPI003F1D79DA